MTVQIPADAVNQTGDDIAPPATDLLQALQLLGNDSDLGDATGFNSAFTGPPQSVALIEAGATALSKWWAAGLATAFGGIWAAIVGFWGKQDHSTQRVVLWVASIATAAAILAIGYILGSDVRGRSLATVSSIEARSKIATAMLHLAQTAYRPQTVAAMEQTMALPQPLSVDFVRRPRDDEAGWRAIAIAIAADNTTRYLLIKGPNKEWADASDIRFV
jgi:hypothetical protein